MRELSWKQASSVFGEKISLTRCLVSLELYLLLPFFVRAFFNNLIFRPLFLIPSLSSHFSLKKYGRRSHLARPQHFGRVRRPRRGQRRPGRWRRRQRMLRLALVSPRLVTSVLFQVIESCPFSFFFLLRILLIRSCLLTRPTPPLPATAVD